MLSVVQLWRVKKFNRFTMRLSKEMVRCVKPVSYNKKILLVKILCLCAVNLTNRDSSVGQDVNN